MVACRHYGFNRPCFVHTHSGSSVCGYRNQSQRKDTKGYRYEYLGTYGNLPLAKTARNTEPQFPQNPYGYPVSQITVYPDIT